MRLSVYFALVLVGVRLVPSVSADLIVGLVLVDVNTGNDIGNLGDGAEAPVNMELSVRADTVSGVKNVEFTYEGTTKNDPKPPFAMNGNKGSDYKSVSYLSTQGEKYVEVTAYKDDISETMSLHFWVGPAPGPTSVPSFSPSSEPSTAPTGKPSTSHAPSPGPIPPSAPGTCPDIPQLPVSSFEEPNDNSLRYPYNTAESAGAVIDDDLVIVSGFYGGFSDTTTQVWAKDATIKFGSWRQMDDLPTPTGEGVSHTAYVVVGTKYYMCGGYLGTSPGPNIPYCFVYDHIAPAGQQWAESADFPDLPRTAENVPHTNDGTGGGGMIYDTESNHLVYAGGAVRDDANGYGTHDVMDAWKIDLGNLAAGWKNVTNIPHTANHISFVTAKDDMGVEHHFFLGGQDNGDEGNGNHKEVYEYIVPTDTWFRHPDMPYTRGHSGASTDAYGCGFIISGGTTNEFGRTTDILYYHIPSQTWTSIGNLPSEENTPVCSIWTPPPGSSANPLYHCATPFGFLTAAEIAP